MTAPPGGIEVHVITAFSTCGIYQWTSSSSQPVARSPEIGCSRGLFGASGSSLGSKTRSFWCLSPNRKVNTAIYTLIDCRSCCIIIEEASF
ncbi:hypothetical protein OPV22_023077 [Ensete ventricosum]|uniref:Uncharacterized protein n=1 Tax=Ensete ventricosum TaxID=4639 RepID=A0AAV8QTX1_ENSVE|nr:hypothetical protein OPV22_023077 [Ensete ventricosum]